MPAQNLLAHFSFLSRLVVDNTMIFRKRDIDDLTLQRLFSVVKSPLFIFIASPQMGKEKQSRIKRHFAQDDATDFMGSYDQIPKYMQENQHIRQGYRIGYDSPQKVMKSLFMVHNETVNIWTHLIGAFIIIFLTFQAIAYGMEESHVLGKAIVEPAVTAYKLSSRHKLIEMCEQGQKLSEVPFQCALVQSQSAKESVSSDSEDERFDSLVPSWPILLGLLGGSICLSCSAVYHWFFQMNEKINKISMSLDLAGIGMNMMFTPIPIFYYAFYCDKQTAYTYLAINITVGTASLVSNLFSWAQRHENRGLRILVLTIATVACSASLVHVFVNEFIFGNNGDSFTIRPSLYFLCPAVLCYWIGFLFFLTKCPERKRPGHYDICGHSHQIWHVFTIFAIIFTYLGSLTCYEMRSQYSMCPVTISTDFQ